MSNLEEVQRRLQEHGVHLKRNKCQFFQSSVDYLSHHIDVDGLGVRLEPSRRHPFLGISFLSWPAELLCQIYSKSGFLVTSSLCTFTGRPILEVVQGL